MGLCAEKTADDFKITRELNDSFAISSYERAIDAINSGRNKHEYCDPEEMPKDKKAKEIVIKKTN